MKTAGVFYPGSTATPTFWMGSRGSDGGRTVGKRVPVRPGDGLAPDLRRGSARRLREGQGGVVQQLRRGRPGNAEAKVKLEKGVETYEAGVREAEKLAATVTDIMSGVSYVDLMTSPRFDLTTLAGKMDARPGTKVTVQKKAVGPIAAKCGGIQYSLAVVKAFQAEINLQGLLPTGFTSSPESGIISNTSFLLHVSQGVWESQVLPALTAKFGG